MAKDVKEDNRSALSEPHVENEFMVRFNLRSACKTAFSCINQTHLFPPNSVVFRRPLK